MRRFVLLLIVLGATVAGFAAGSSGGGTNAQPHWVIRDLGTLGGGFSRALAINDRGQVVGYSYPRGPISVERPFLWRDGQMTGLGVLHRRWDTDALDINERGQIVGYTSTGDAEGREIGWRSLLWESGKMTTLPSGGRANQAAAINDRGLVVGWADLRRVVGRGEDGPAYPVRRAALWQAGTMRFLRMPRADSEPTGLNASGQVIGMMDDWERGFVWQNGKAHDLGRLGDDGWLSAINDRGQIVGYRNGHPTVWVNGVPRPLPLPSVSKSDGSATDINERGQIVGWWTRETQQGNELHRAVLWEKARPKLLPNLPGGTESQALAINDRGQIVGWAYPKVGDDEHAVLWTLKRG